MYISSAQYFHVSDFKMAGENDSRANSQEITGCVESYLSRRGVSWQRPNEEGVDGAVGGEERDREECRDEARNKVTGKRMVATAAAKEIMGKSLRENRGMSVHQTASPQVYLSESCHC